MQQPGQYTFTSYYTKYYILGFGINSEKRKMMTVSGTSIKHGILVLLFFADLGN